MVTTIDRTYSPGAPKHVVDGVEIPEILLPLFEKARYKVAYSGRGAAKSWTFARMALLRGQQRPELILCIREVQKSIADSVHRILKNQIQKLNLGHFYTVTDTSIRGKNGTEFIFAGLSGQTADSLKSYEGVTICWVEEGQAVSNASWKILIPTIRVPGSEIWISMNPAMDTNATWIRFVLKPPKHSKVIQTNWRYNPWFSEENNDDRLHDLATLSTEEYDNIWEGKCLTTVPGSIYPQEIVAAIHDRRFVHCPYTPQLKVQTIWDLGFNDFMAIILVQVIRSEIRIIDYLEGSYKTDDWWAAYLQRMNLNWGKDYIPHDGEHHHHTSGDSTRTILTKMGRRVAAPGSVPGPMEVTREQGILRTRGIFSRCIFNDRTALRNDMNEENDEPGIEKIEGVIHGRRGVARLIECLKHYRRNIPKTTDEPAEPMRDQYCHGADAFRHLALSVDKMTNDTDTRRPIMKPRHPRDRTMGMLG